MSHRPSLPPAARAATRRLLLRRFTPADAGHLYRLDNDPEVMRYLNGGIPTPRHVITTQILPTFLQYDDSQPLFGFWAAETRADGDFAGWFSLRPAAEGEPLTAALGYRLRRAMWGRGLATEGARGLIGHAFQHTAVTRIIATTYEHNTASRRVMEKLGMVLVRRFRYAPEQLQQSDTHHVAAAELWEGDDVVYALEKAAWP